MNAVNLHHVIFTNEKASDVALRSAASFLHPAPERDESPTSQLFSSTVYQDLIQRQPTHPNGPMSGWDLGLNLLGDPITAEEYKNTKDYHTKMKLRRLHAINMAFELLFGTWGTYMAIRYFLAFADGPGDRERTGSLVLGISSALLIALVIISLMMPLFPQQGRPNTWGLRSLLRACYLLLLCAGPLVNLILVILWHTGQFCGWDIDILWYTSAVNATTSLCHPAPFGAWIAAAIARLVVTWTIVLLFLVTMRSYHDTRHPSERSSPKYSPYFPSDPEDMSPISTSSPLHHLKSKLSRSDDSGHMHNRSNATLPKYTSISTLAASTSCTGHSRPHSTPPPNDKVPFKNSPPMSRRASIHHGPTQSLSETSPQTQSTSATEPSSVLHMLRHKSRVSLTRLSLATLSSYPERSDSQVAREASPSETRSTASSRPCRSGSLDLRKTTTAWESHGRQASQTSVSSSLSSQESVPEEHAYGYGAVLPAYPYLDMYNPLPQAGDHPRGVVCPDASSASTCREGSSEEEYVAMMGGFVRRMATIESLGSREATSGVPSRTPGSSLRFASASSAGAVVGALSREGSLSTAYLSFSSGERVNERGELSRSAASSPYDRVYYTATSGGSFARDNVR